MAIMTIALIWLAIHKHNRAGLTVALGAGLVSDIIFPAATFGFWLLYNLAAWLLIRQLARSFFAGRGSLATMFFIFLVSLLYGAGALGAGYAISRWQTGASQAAGADILSVIGSAVAAAAAGGLFLLAVNYCQRWRRRWFLTR